MLLRLLVWLNILDTLLTVSVVSLKWATEANPVMETLLQAGPLAFGAVKMSLSIGGAYLLWKARGRTRWPIAKIVAALVCCYIGIVAYEVAMIAFVLFGGRT